VTVTPEPLVGWGHICALWKGIKSLYHFYIEHFSWFCTVSNQRVLRDHCQSKSKSIFKVFPLVHCVPTIITSSLLIGFERMSNNWKFEKVNYEFVLQVFWDDDVSVVKNTVFPGGSSLSAQTYNSLADVQKFITLRPFIVLGHVNNHWKEGRVFYNYCIGIPVIFQTCECQNWIFWLLLIDKSELTSVSEIFVLKIA
jgi:hypothetical protein